MHKMLKKSITSISDSAICSCSFPSVGLAIPSMKLIIEKRATNLGSDHVVALVKSKTIYPKLSSFSFCNYLFG